MDKPLHAVIETPEFIRSAKAAGMTDSERLAAVNAIAADPSKGDLVQGSGGIRKVRIAKRGGGKSGGYRVVAVLFDEDFPVILLSVLAKGDRANWSVAQIAAMKEIVTSMKAEYRRRRKG